MPTLPTHIDIRSIKTSEVRARSMAVRDVENARMSSTPDALTVIDTRPSTLGLRGLADGFVVL